MAAASVINVTNDNFKSDVLESDLPVLVDFWAVWCGPCQRITPIIDELSSEMEGKVRFAKLNIDEANATAIEYGVTSIPTLILFKNGEEVDRLMGAYPKPVITEFVTKNS